MQKINEFVSKYFLLIILVLSIGAIWALFVPGYFGASDDVHIAWLYEMHYLVSIGQFPPRYVPDLSFGFGYPLFNFVFPLPYYIGEIFHLIGFSLVDSIKIVFGLTIPVSMIGMYQLGRRAKSSEITSLAMAVMYGYAPYRALDLYIRGAYGEIVALMFLPWLVWVVCGVVEGGIESWHRVKLILIGALLLGGFVLSHNITAYMFLPWLGILGLILVFRSSANRLRNIKNLGLMFVLGLIGSSYFWLPALIESNLMKYDTVFNFIDHFPTLRQLIKPYWGYGASVPGPYDGMSFFLGFSNILVAVVMLTVGWVSWKKNLAIQKVLFSWSVVVLTWSLLMMNFRSTQLWNIIPLIAQFQFPWRFLILVSLGIPILLVVIGNGKKAMIFSIGVILVTILANYSYFRPQDFLGRTDEYFMQKYLVYPKMDPLYLTQSEEYLRLPMATSERPKDIFPDFFGVLGSIKDSHLRNRLDMSASINQQADGNVSVNKYAYPGWKIAIDNKLVEYSSGQPYGQILVKMPKGQHTIRAWFEESSFRLIFDLISLATVLMLTFGLVFTSLILKKRVK